jgi:hypothetical protein
MPHILSILSTLLLFSLASAQFQFFEQMFQGQGGHQQQHHRQEPQNVPSDSKWYQQNYENGTYTFPTPSLLPSSLPNPHPISLSISVPIHRGLFLF